MDATADLDAPFLPLDDPSFSMRDPIVAEARKKSWFARTPYGLAVLRHREMQELLINRGLRQGSHAWPALNGVTSGLFHDWWGRTILVTEGKDHTRMRRLVNPAFSPRLLDEMRPKFVDMAEALTAKFAGEGQCDFMAEFADPYASEVLCLMLGLPAEEAPRVLSLASDMGLALGVDFVKHLDRINTATEAMFDYADGLIADRRGRLGDDFMSVLVGASSDADQLSEMELKDMIVMLVFAGIDTTRNQLGLGLAMFMDHLDQWEMLAQTPALAPQAVEEVMRVRPTITWVTREAVDDVDYRGVTIPKGTTLHLLSGSAGSDEQVYAEDGFDITAERTRHFGFGGGVHHCLGHAIARSDMEVALSVLPARIANPRPDGPGAWLPDSGNTGPIRLPIRFDPR